MTTSFDLIRQYKHEAVFFMSDPEVDLHAFVGLHNTALGPGLGGCRVMHYENESAALEDVLRLSKAMTFKNALAGLNYGGGKGLIYLQPGQEKTPELVDAFARRLALLNGRYFTAGDIGSNALDMARIKAITPYVSGLSPEDGGLGDSSILTGYGVFMGIKAAVKHRLKTEDLSGLKVAVQGAGKVGYYLMEHLVKAGCQVMAADVNQEALENVKADYPSVEIVAPEAIWQQEADILSPNAIGGTITEAVVESTNAKIIAGGANNPLADESLSDLLLKREILYAPDFSINSGGVIVLSTELEKGTIEQAKAKTEGIYHTAERVFAYASEQQVSPLDAALAIAWERIDGARA